MTTKAAVCQVPDIREDPGAALEWIEKFAVRAEAENVSLVCFPECFLQGYLTERCLAEKYAVSFDSSAFAEMLGQLARYNPTIVFGLIEKEGADLFNTAVVVKNGSLLGKYRKRHLLEGERIFKAGDRYPVFETSGLRFGINICYDTQFAEAAAGVAAQGIKLLLRPANNMMRRATAEKYKHLHHKIRIQRARENKIWLLSADVTGTRDDRIAYGPTSAINPDGEVIAQVPLMQTGMTTIEI